jgi:hypothetical protein
VAHRRRFVLALAAVVGMWFGFAAPLAVFLLTGVPLPAVLAAAFASCCIAIACVRRCPPAARLWLRALFGGAAFGLIAHAVYVMVGGWQFGS